MESPSRPSDRNKAALLLKSGNFIRADRTIAVRSARYWLCPARAISRVMIGPQLSFSLCTHAGRHDVGSGAVRLQNARAASRVLTSSKLEQRASGRRAPLSTIGSGQALAGPRIEYQCRPRSLTPCSAIVGSRASFGTRVGSGKNDKARNKKKMREARDTVPSATCGTASARFVSSTRHLAGDHRLQGQRATLVLHRHDVEPASAGTGTAERCDARRARLAP